ncbi:PVC-type heme-binding CxxCH protein [Thalassoglobus sp. JC818]|uniref:PVC-type heme-binding CxxCH protein n=1 Tax=Thalassoglobus sp. JC818 TaxID=3232136 RepID=UPI00345AE90A
MTMRQSIVCVSLLFTSLSAAYAQRDLKEIPSPDPELERETFILPEGFEVNLFAADPAIAKPIQMNFDPQGRLWIASSETYPHIEPGAVANDKILYLQDVDGDGVSDRTEIFADGLLIPTGVIPGDGGVYVGASTELLHFKDTDGDGKADEKRIVLSGFGTEDTHHILHTLRYGPESLLYFNQSIYIHSHIETPWGIRRLNAGGIWRFRPETLELEVFARGLVNQWGTDFDQYGQTFATDGAGGEGINYIVPGASYVTAFGANRILHGLNPGSPKHCGLEIVETPDLPEDWQGSLITNDFRGHRVCRFVLTESGSGYRSQEQQEVIKSDHVAFRPVDVKQGPDGSIYIADWYNPIIQHGEVDFRDPRRDHTHGRIWRVTYTGNKTNPPLDIGSLDVDQLLELVATSNRYYRQQAKVVLKEQGESILPTVKQWATSVKDNQQDRLLLEGLWIFQSLGQLEHDLLNRCLNSDNHSVRAAATRVVGQMVSKIDAPLQILSERILDSHPQVRLEAICALSHVTDPSAVEVALQALTLDVDENIDYALWMTCRDLEPYWAPALARGELSLDAPPQALPFLLRATNNNTGVATLVTRLKDGTLTADSLDDALKVLADLGTKEHLGEVYDLVLAEQTPLKLRADLLNTLTEAARQRNQVANRPHDPLSDLLNEENPAFRVALIRYVGASKATELRSAIEELIAKENASLGERIEAIHSFGQFSDAASASRLTQVAKSQMPPEIRRAALIELLRFRPQQAPALIADFLQTAPPQVIEPLFYAIIQRKGAEAAVAAAMKDLSYPKDVAVIGSRVLGSSGQQDSELAKVLRQSGQLADEPVQLSSEEMQHLVAQIQANGNPARGEEIFRRADLNCLKCHAIGPAGGQIGSNLVSLGATAQLDYVVESLLDPNAKVKEGYHTVVVATDEGKVYSGIQTRESDDSLYLRDAEGREHVVIKDEIVQQKQGLSLMPAGLTSSITNNELLDLCAFLSSLGRTPEFTIGTKPVVRNWETIEATNEAAYQLRRTSYADTATDNDAFQWKTVYSYVDGRLNLNDLPEVFVRNRSAPGNRGMSFVRVKFESTDGIVGFDLQDSTGLQIWLDGQPIESAKRIQAETSAGPHQLTIAVDRAVRTSPILLSPVNGDDFAIIDLPAQN